MHIPKIKTVRRLQEDKFINDSLKIMIINFDSLFQNQLSQSKFKDSVIEKISHQTAILQTAFNDLRQRASDYETLNFQIKKNNFVLVIFNSFVCLLLFIMLVRYLFRSYKKKSSGITNHNRDLVRTFYNSSDVSPQDRINYNLQQLEKIGKLRELGVLTDDEFRFQKIRILSNSK
ncbi:MAG: hypothetical protein ABIS37_07795 [Bacteroidia bacterium]